MRPDLKERVLAAIAAQPSPPRSRFRRRRIAVLAGAAAISITILALARGFPAPATWPATSLGDAAIATIAVAAALRSGRSMLGRSRPAHAALPLLLGAWGLVSVSALAQRPWASCLVVVLATGVAPLAALLHLRRGTAAAHPRRDGWVLGAAAGAFSWLLVGLGCPAGPLAHLLLGHILPVLLLAAAGALALR